MARDEAYREAKRKIEEAGRSRSTELDLENIGLTELPESIGKLVDIKVLHLGYNYDKGGEENKLSTLPQALGNLSHLEKLSLYDNKLSEVPEVLGNLSRLQYLSLSYNQLMKVPSFLGNLTQLEKLSLSYNQLTEVPEVL